MTPSAAQHLEHAIDDALARADIPAAQQLVERYLATAGEANPSAPPASTLWFRARYLAAQVELAAGELHRALETLNQLTPTASALPVEVSARLQLFEAEAQARLNCHQVALLSLQSIPQIWLMRQPQLQFRALRVRLQAGEVRELAEPLQRWRQELEASGDWANLALLHIEEGRGWDAAGDLVRAERCWLAAEDLNGQHDSGTVRADVQLQLGRLDHLRGRLPAALRRYDAALASSRYVLQQQEIELRRALVRLELGQVEAARHAVQGLLPSGDVGSLGEELRALAAALLRLLNLPGSDSATTEELAWTAQGKGDLEKACQLYRQALAETPTPQRQARLALALGLLSHTQREAGEAQRWLDQAAEQARRLNLPEVLARALQGLGRLHAELKGDEERARALFEEAVLVTEVQAGEFTHAVDAAAYRQQRHSALRELLRSAARRGDANAVFRYQELERGRLLLELWRSGVQWAGRVPLWDSPELARLEVELGDCEAKVAAPPATPAEFDQRHTLLQRRELLLRQRDQLLDEHLREHSRRDSTVIPSVPEPGELRALLPPGTLYIAPTIVGDELHVLGESRDEGVLFCETGATELLTAVTRWRGCVAEQLERYRRGLSLGHRERQELDQCLGEISRGPLGVALRDLLAIPGIQRIIWVPDEPLHGLPLSAIPLDASYLIERAEIVHGFSGALVVQQAQTQRQRRSRWRPALVVNETPKVLPAAEREAEGVAATFWRRRTFSGATADRQQIRRWLARAQVAHFACHADFDAARPLAAVLHLPSGENLRALDWLAEPVDGLNLATLSACRSGEVGAILGSEVFGLTAGLLGAGVRSVLASFWPVADRETLPLMWRFYRHLLTTAPATALARAQRESLQQPDSSPLFWAAFALLGEPDSLPPPQWPWSWLARWRQRSHAQQFPVT